MKRSYECDRVETKNATRITQIVFQCGRSLSVNHTVLRGIKTIQDMIDTLQSDDDDAVIPRFTVDIEMTDISLDIVARYCDLWIPQKHEHWEKLTEWEKSVLPLEPAFMELFSTIKTDKMAVIGKIYHIANFLNFVDLTIDVKKYMSHIIHEACQSKTESQVFALNNGRPPRSLWHGKKVDVGLEVSKREDIIAEVGGLLSGK